jgi:hypothetical protein
MVSTDSGDETARMNTRSNLSRRSSALIRLDQLRFATVLAAAGGTAAFGALAAFTWSGNTATAAADQVTNGGSVTSPSSGSTNRDEGFGSGSTGQGGTSAQPQAQSNQDSGQLSPFIPVQPRFSSGRAHASSGGS